MYSLNDPMTNNAHIEFLERSRLVEEVTTYKTMRNEA